MVEDRLRGERRRFGQCVVYFGRRRREPQPRERPGQLRCGVRVAAAVEPVRRQRHVRPELQPLSLFGEPAHDFVAALFGQPLPGLRVGRPRLHEQLFQGPAQQVPEPRIDIPEGG